MVKWPAAYRRPTRPYCVIARATVGAAAASTLWCGMSWAAPIVSPDFAHLPPIAARTTSQQTGEVLFTTRTWIEPFERNGEQLIAVRSLIFEPAGVTVEEHTLVRAEATVRALEQETRVHGANGETLAVNMKQFRADALPFAAASVPDDTYPPRATLLYLLGSLPLDGQGRGSFHVLGEAEVWRMEVSDDGRDEITVPAGRFACRRMRLRPDPESLHFPGFLRPFARYFIPEFRAWIALDAPHLAVRIEGPMGPPRERDVVVELIAVGADATGASPPSAAANSKR